MNPCKFLLLAAALLLNNSTAFAQQKRSPSGGDFEKPEKPDKSDKVATTTPVSASDQAKVIKAVGEVVAAAEAVYPDAATLGLFLPAKKEKRPIGGYGGTQLIEANSVWLNASSNFKNDPTNAKQQELISGIVDADGNAGKKTQAVALKIHSLQKLINELKASHDNYPYKTLTKLLPENGKANERSIREAAGELTGYASIMDKDANNSAVGYFDLPTRNILGHEIQNIGSIMGVLNSRMGRGAVQTGTVRTGDTQGANQRGGASLRHAQGIVLTDFEGRELEEGPIGGPVPSQQQAPAKPQPDNPAPPAPAPAPVPGGDCGDDQCDPNAMTVVQPPAEPAAPADVPAPNANLTAKLDPPSVDKGGKKKSEGSKGPDTLGWLWDPIGLINPANALVSCEGDKGKQLAGSHSEAQLAAMEKASANSKKREELDRQIDKRQKEILAECAKEQAAIDAEPVDPDDVAGAQAEKERRKAVKRGLCEEKIATAVEPLVAKADAAGVKPEDEEKATMAAELQVADEKIAKQFNEGIVAAADSLRAHYKNPRHDRRLRLEKATGYSGSFFRVERVDKYFDDNWKDVGAPKVAECRAKLGFKSAAEQKNIERYKDPNSDNVDKLCGVENEIVAHMNSYKKPGGAAPEPKAAAPAPAPQSAKISVNDLLKAQREKKRKAPVEAPKDESVEPTSVSEDK